jgi:hypothetical protein
MKPTAASKMFNALLCRDRKDGKRLSPMENMNLPLIHNVASGAVTTAAQAV